MIKQPPLPTGRIELGEDHWMRFTVWAPDMDINPQYAHLSLLIRENPVCGAIIGHKCKTETGEHEGGISFRTELTDLVPGFKDAAMWEVESWEPLTISPSLLAHCPCKDHGFIKQGKWIRA